MDKQWLEEKIKESHEKEDILNKEIGEIDKQVKELNRLKMRKAFGISGNMRNRNSLIEKLNNLKKIE